MLASKPIFEAELKFDKGRPLKRIHTREIVQIKPTTLCCCLHSALAIPQTAEAFPKTATSSRDPTTNHPW
jgi:hypothetical protein